MSLKTHLLAAPAAAAVFSLLASPAAAAPAPLLPADRVTASVVESLTYQNRPHRGYRRDRGVDAGDVIAGVLLIGGIAAIASAATRDDDRRDDYPRDPYRGADGRDWRDAYRAGDGLGNAAEMCADEVEQERRVGTIDRVDRRAGGWTVTGTTDGGEDFTCTIGNDGRVDDISYRRATSDRGTDDDHYDRGDDRYDRDQRYDDDRDDDGRYDDGRYDDDRYDDGRYDRQATLPEDRQWDAERYRLERERLDRDGGRPPVAEPRDTPAYPGAPVPGDDQRDDGEETAAPQDDWLI